MAASSTEFASSSATTGELGFEASNGIDLGAAGRGGARASRSSFFESSSYSATGDVSGLGGASSFGGFGSGADSAFAAADTNRDGVLSRSEFRNAGY